MATSYQDRETYGRYADVTGEGPGPDSSHGPGPHLMGAVFFTLVGNAVFNKKGEGLGTIKEIMLDMRTGRVSYAVLSFGGFLGMGEKLFAVPWKAMTLDSENKRFQLDVEPDYLKDAPGFDKTRWLDMADPTWARSIHSFYLKGSDGD